MIQEKTEQYGSIDIAKFIMAIIVVAMHRGPFPADTLLSYLNNPVIGGMAVPFFFASSAFLLFSKIDRHSDQQKEIVKSFVLKNITVYIIWSIIYIPCIFVRNHTGHYSEINFKMMIGQVFVYIRNLIFGQSFVHLWFLYTLVLSVILVYLLRKKLKAEYIFLLAFIAHIALNFIDFEKIPVFNNFFLCNMPALIHNLFDTGFISVSLGAVLAKNRRLIPKKLNVVLLIASLIVLIAAGVYSYYCDEAYDSFVLGLDIFIAALILQLCLSVKVPVSPTTLLLRRYSTFIYLTHFLLMKEAFAYMANLAGTQIIVTLQFEIDLIFAFALSTLIIYMQNKGRYKWLKYLG